LGIKDTLIRQRNLFILRTLPPCKEIAKIISASLDRPLSLRERLVMRLHLVACKPCTRYFEQSHFLSHATHVLDDRLKDDVFSGRLSDEARERIKTLLSSA
jgi:hypothetical protein